MLTRAITLSNVSSFRHVLYCKIVSLIFTIQKYLLSRKYLGTLSIRILHFNQFLHIFLNTVYKKCTLFYVDINFCLFMFRILNNMVTYTLFAINGKFKVYGMKKMHFLYFEPIKL